MSKPFYVELQGRGAVRIEGPDAKTFLQGLVSNDMEKVSADALVYTCLLTPQGKFLHDFFVREEDGALILDCEGGARAQDLHDRLSKFKLRSKVTLSLEEKISVFAVFNAADGMPDPRHTDMGRRSYTKPDMEEKPFDIWDHLRISLCIPDGGRDMELEKSTLLEGHIDKLNGIDWKKGCYMGQELTARMHYRGLAKKHLRIVKLNGTPSPFTDLPDGAQMRSACGDIGLALMKDDDTQDTITWP